MWVAECQFSLMRYAMLPGDRSGRGMRCLCMLVDHYSADDPVGVVIRNELACIYTLQHNHEAAERLFLESFDSHETYLGPDHKDTQTVRRNLTVLERFLKP